MNELRKVGRPVGTSESIESLARKSAQLDLKMIEKNRDGIKRDMERITERLNMLDPEAPNFIALSEYRLALHEALMKSAAVGAKLAAADPQKAGDGEIDAVAREITAQIRGEEV